MIGSKRVLAFALVSLLFLSVSLPMSSATQGRSEIYVDVANCPNFGDGSVEDPYCTIADAVIASSPSDTIWVNAGTYELTGSITISHPLSLKGAGSGQSALVRSAGGLGETIVDIEQTSGGFLIQSSLVSIDGFDIRGDESTRWGIYVSGAQGNLSDIEINNNFIHGMAKRVDGARSTSWGILTDAKPGGTATNTIDGLEIRGNEIYDIGGVGGSIGLGISLHEVHSVNEGGGALIENNRFADIHDGLWGGLPGVDGLPTPGMAIFAHEQVNWNFGTSYPDDQQGGVTVQNNLYERLDVGAALQLTDGGVFNEDNSNFNDVGVYMINVGDSTTVEETKLEPYAKTGGKNLSLLIGESTAYFSSASEAVAHTVVASQNSWFTIELSDGVFDEILTISNSEILANLMLKAEEGASPEIVGGVNVQATYLIQNLTFDGLTLDGGTSSGQSMFHINAPGGISDLTIKNMVFNGNSSSSSAIIASGLREDVEISNNEFNDIDGNFIFTTTPNAVDTGAGQLSSVDFSGNIISDSASTIRIKPVNGLISQTTILNNQFSNSGANGVPMLILDSIGSIAIQDNIMSNLTSSVAIDMTDVRFATISDNNMSELVQAISISQSSPNTIDTITVTDNIFTTIDQLVIDAPLLTSADIVAEDNWFGTTNMSSILESIDGDVLVQDQWYSWPGEDSDGDGWSDTYDICNGFNDALDSDFDGIPDGCDPLNDRDGDLVGDTFDNCLDIENTDQDNYDNDMYGDLCDDDDDGDGVLDENDSCPKGNKGWTPTLLTDYDNDGCWDFSEDLDDDNDGVNDRDVNGNVLDGCSASIGSLKNWISNETNDIDGDGCLDSVEDDDDDADGLNDDEDACPQGEVIRTNDGLIVPIDISNDMDLDGCRDGAEDDDDDGDGVLDEFDLCPELWTETLNDLDKDGCDDAIKAAEDETFFEQLLAGEITAIGIILIPIVLLLVVGQRTLILTGRGKQKKKMMDIVASATNPLQLRRAANQATSLFEAGIISNRQFQQIISEIEDRKFEFDDDDVLMEQKENDELASVMEKAVSLGLTTDAATKRMFLHVQAGRFSPGHYIDLWNRRIADHTFDNTPTKPVSENKRKRVRRKQETVANEDAEDIVEMINAEIENVEEDSTKPELPDLDTMTKKELTDLLKERDLPVSGKKSELIDRLIKWAEEG